MSKNMVTRMGISAILPASVLLAGCPIFLPVDPVNPEYDAGFLAGFAVEVLVAPGIIMTAYSIDGYVWTWVVAFIVMVIGTVAAFKLRTDKMGSGPTSVRK